MMIILVRLKRCLALAELLNNGMQLPGDVSTRLSPKCFIPFRGVKRSIL